MSVYVDMLLPCVPTPLWRYTESCHLVADTLDELHAFAAEVGLPWHWFQAGSLVPHYDLTKGKRAKAIALGAIALDTRKDIKATWPKCEGYKGTWKVEDVS